MKTFTRMAAQGDFIIMRIPSIPNGVEPMKSDDAFKHVIAHSETGHNHVMDRQHVDAFVKTGTKEVDLYELFLSVKEDTPIEHLRSFDTHESIMVPPGNYIVKRQREYTPEGFRRAAD